MKENMKNNNPAGGAIYGLGLIGAAIYFISTAAGLMWSFQLSFHSL